MRPTQEQILQFETEAQAKGVPLAPIVSCLPDGCDDEETIYVVARGTTKNEAREMLPHLLGMSERQIINHAMVITLGIFMPGGEILTDGRIVDGIKDLHDASDRFVGRIVDATFAYLGARNMNEEGYTEVLSPRTTAGDAAKFGLPPEVLSLRDRYQSPGALRMVRADDLPSLVLRRPTGDDEMRFQKSAAGNRMWGAYVEHARRHVAFPEAEAARNAIFEEHPGYAIPLVGILSKMRSGGAREEGKGGPRPSAKRGG